MAEVSAIGGWRGTTRAWGDAILHAYAQILFSRSRVVGALLLAATSLEPRVALGGVLSVLGATAVSRLLRFDGVLIREGHFGYNALLIGLAGMVLFVTSGVHLLLLGGAVIASVFVTAALRSMLGGVFNLPALSLPFVGVFYLLLGAAPSVGVSFMEHQAALPWSMSLPASLDLFFRSLGAIFFLPRWDVGAIVLIALLVHSRIGLLLGGMGFGVASLFLLALAGGQGTTSALPTVLGFNFILVGVALGGVWFVPSISSFVLALIGVMLCGMISLGTLGPLRTMGFPLLIFPFNATVLLVLHALRQRVVDGHPKAVDFLAGSPEENLGYFRTRIARFGARYIQRFSAPFRGRWICTQGIDGAESHQGPWRYAADFEVQGEDEQVYSGEGRTVADFHCYRLPVLAPADGTVVKVVDGIEDNPIGEVNLEKNWGNLIILNHGRAVYTKLCHLSPGTIKVREGQVVRRGDLLGSCGNSGRSAVPHLHFQIQPTGRVGSGTSPIELHDVVDEGDVGHDEGPRLRATVVPEKGRELRNIEVDRAVRGRFELVYERPMTFDVECNGRSYREEITPKIDIYGHWLLASNRGATLYYERGDSIFTVYDVLGERRSLLHALRASLARVPFEARETLHWRDFLPLGRVMSWPMSWVDDFVSPFVAGRRVEMTYGLRWEDDRLVVEGRSEGIRRGDRVSTTLAKLSRDRGIEYIEWRYGKRRCVARRVEASRSEEK